MKTAKCDTKGFDMDTTLSCIFQFYYLTIQILITEHNVEGTDKYKIEPYIQNLTYVLCNINGNDQGVGGCKGEKLYIHPILPNVLNNPRPFNLVKSKKPPWFF